MIECKEQLDLGHGRDSLPPTSPASPVLEAGSDAGAPVVSS